MVLGQRATQVRELTAEAHDTRCQWEVLTETTRRVARAADIELKRRGVLGPDDVQRSAEPEGFKYPERDRTADVWVQPHLDGTVELPREEQLTPAGRERQALEVLGLNYGHDQPELPLQVTDVAEYNRQRQAQIDGFPLDAAARRRTRRDRPRRSLERHRRAPSRRRHPAAQTADPGRRRHHRALGRTRSRMTPRWCILDGDRH